MTKIFPIPAFKDNYIWAIHSPEGSEVLVVDPGSAEEVLDYLHKTNTHLSAILVTHHHWDHTGGILALQKIFPTVQVYGPAKEKVQGLTHPMNDQDKLTLPAFGLEFTIMDIPGHTLGHIAYFDEKHLFCGDTLFSCGCGRVFEGTPAQMLNSLEKIKKLNPNTQIYCGHEYTLANIAFAKKVEPLNSSLEERLNEVLSLQKQHHPSLPVTLACELKTNPFLRCEKSSVIQSVEKYSGLALSDPVQVFAHLREWKNQF